MISQTFGRTESSWRTWVLRRTCRASERIKEQTIQADQMMEELIQQHAVTETKLRAVMTNLKALKFIDRCKLTVNENVDEQTSQSPLQESFLSPSLFPNVPAGPESFDLTTGQQASVVQKINILGRIPLFNVHGWQLIPFEP